MGSDVAVEVVVVVGMGGVLVGGVGSETGLGVMEQRRSKSEDAASQEHCWQVSTLSTGSTGIIELPEELLAELIVELLVKLPAELIVEWLAELLVKLPAELIAELLAELLAEVLVKLLV